MYQSTLNLHFSELISQFPERQKEAHKGDFGQVAIVGGNRGMAGAVMLAAKACYRVGAGVVKVFTHPHHEIMPTLFCPEIQTLVVNDGIQLKEKLKGITVVVLGPGLGQDAWAIDLMETILSHAPLPMVVDADALRLLPLFSEKRSHWILTPHVGEIAALLKMNSEVIKTQRQTAAESLQAQYGGVVIMKGHPTLVVESAEHPIAVCQEGNPGMATAGMGDVLSGVVGGLLAQGLSLSLAAKLGVMLHAKAGDSVAKEQGERGMIASDLFFYLRFWVNQK